VTSRTRIATVRAQAKLNLFLRVGPRESDGYHQLLTLFHRIDLADELTISVGGGDRILSCSGPAMPPEGLGESDRNLAMRAATLYAQECGWPDGFHIDLVKRIPVGGGLGGGSADAAAVLRTLDAMSPEPLGDGLLELARQLGADVPFLVSDRVAAFALGHGDELMTPQLSDPPLRPLGVLLLVPSFGVGTAEAYRWLDDSDRPTPSGGLSLGPWSWRTIERLARDVGNDFEPVVEAHHPEIRTCRELLERAGARIARMSGSGSTVFGIFDGPTPELSGLPPGVTQLASRISARVVQVEAQE
jgi:4-diphosphocytidyl-2-C-methyl-D-erythritol kinase